MKCIVKGREPRSLVVHYKETYADYDNYPDKDELQTSLLTEQGYICCYCMQRISDHNMKIEHWKSQSNYPHLQLEYNNLLGAYKGSEGFPSQLQHCDTKKCNTDITINPLDKYKNCEDLIRYDGNGKIYSNDIVINRELDEVLNLNMQTLKNNRRAVLYSVIEKLKKKRLKGNWTIPMLTQEINKWDNKEKNGEYKEYCQIVIYYLRKKSQQLRA